MKNPLAGKKAKVLYRNPDKSTVLQVEDPNDEILVTVEEDGTMFEERWSGIKGARQAWEASSPAAGAVLVPDDTGRKTWTRLEPEPKPTAPTPTPEQVPASERPPAPEPKPEPTAPVPAAVESRARALAQEVHARRVMRQGQLFPNGVPATAEALIAHAVSEQWIVEDSDGLLRSGPVSPYLPAPMMEAGRSDGWTHRFFART